jgi:hypothetical protein
MQVNPSSSEILVVAPPAQRTHEGGIAGGSSSNAGNVCFFAKKEAPLPQPNAAASARHIHPRIRQLLEEFSKLVRPPTAAPQP